MSICSKCRYAASPNEVGNVECHRYPPVGRINIFPLMRSVDWCGEWVRSASVPAESAMPDLLEVIKDSAEILSHLGTAGKNPAQDEAIEAVRERCLTAVAKATE